MTEMSEVGVEKTEEVYHTEDAVTTTGTSSKSPFGDGSRDRYDVSIEVEDEGWYPWVVVVVCCVSLWSIVYSLGAPGTWLTEVEAGVGGSNVGNWLPFVAQVVQGVIAPPLNLASDLVGRRWIIVGSLALGCVGSIVTAQAKSMPVAIGGLAIAGCAFVAQSLLHVIASEVMPHRLRAASQGLLNSLGTGVGGTMAAIIGGVFVARNVGGKGGWRWVFYFQAILFAFSATLFGLVYRPQPTPNPDNKTVYERLKRIDFVGSLLLALFVVPFCMGLIWGGNAYKWRSAPVLVPLVVGLFFMVCLIVHQVFYRKDGLFHHDLFRHGRNFLLTVALIFVEGVVFIPFLTYYPFSTAVLWEHRPLLQGLRAAPLFMMYIVISPIWGYWVTKTKTTRIPLILGYSFFIAACIGLALTTPGSSKAAVAYCCLVGLGVSVPLVLLVVLCHFAIPVELLGLGSSLLLLSRCLGGVLGAAITTAIFNSKITANIPAYIAKYALAAGASPDQLSQIIPAIAAGEPSSLEGVTGITPAIIEAASTGLAFAFSNSFHFVWYTILPFCVLSVILCFFITDIDHLMDHSIDRPLGPGPGQATSDQEKGGHH